MNKLPILGKEIVLNKLCIKDVELHGLSKLMCPNCSNSITTFRKCVHNAHTIVCNRCGQVIKQYIPSVKLQKQVLKNEVNYYKERLKDEISK